MDALPEYQDQLAWREDNRTFLMLKSTGFKGKATDLFPSLKPIFDQQQAADGVNSPMPSGKFLAKLMSAKGGDEGIKELLFKDGKK